MKFDRSSGILLHPTSLPGQYGIGDIGPQAYRWIDFLAETRCSLWQVLPLGPTGYGDSPYQCFSAFAGNPYLISPEMLLEDGLLEPEDLSGCPDFSPGRVDYGNVIEWKLALLDKSFKRFRHTPSPVFKREYQSFQAAKSTWLEDFTLFMALKEAHRGSPWTTWAKPLRERLPEALSEARQKFAEAIQRQAFYQFLFFRQLSALRTYAAGKGIQIIGDIPIFVAHDSADVWAHPELFYLDRLGKPSVVAGVPPDYFSATGQLWGNPIYNWAVHAESGFAWWLGRIQAVLEMVDIVRLDHFRGFAGYWEIPGKATTATKGRWVPSPGMALLKAVKQTLGNLPIIAEDLGVITDDVVELRDHFGLPGMKILQFAFESTPLDPFLPHNYITNCVVYTGTHDNDTARGWYERVPEKSRDFCNRYLASDGREISWDMILAVWRSVAVFALAPMQDFLCLGNEARMNYPGNPSGNWTWRIMEGDISAGLVERIQEINYLFARENPTSKRLLEQEEK